MAKIKTLNEFQSSLDDSFGWRIKEISNLRIAVKAKNSISGKTIIRAGIPLIYAHWEGFVKEASQHYLRYVSSQRLTYKELETCFVVFGIKKHINDLKESWNIPLNIEAVEFLRRSDNERADLSISNAINTKSNLNPEIFSNIADSIGLNKNIYEAYFNFMQESLLDRRNKIAHGEKLDVDADGFRDIADTVLMLLRSYKSDLENSAALEKYKIQAA